jgi:cellulase/cellobiase CelA1
MHTMAKYLIELSIVPISMLQFKASEIAASALWLTLRILRHQAWDNTLSHFSSYTEEAITPCIRELVQVVERSLASRQQAIRTKYAHIRFEQISARVDAAVPELRTYVLSNGAPLF